jgi:hypothetical protein
MKPRKTEKEEKEKYRESKKTWRDGVLTNSEQDKQLEKKRKKKKGKRKKRKEKSFSSGTMES